MKERFLFITRNYPPKIGGLEIYSYHLINEFKKYHSVNKIALTQSNIHLVWFLPYSLLRALYIVWRYSIYHIHLCDGVLAPIGVLLKCITRKPVSISIHGLDITYRNPLFQWVIPWCVARLDRIICVSSATRAECIKRKVPLDKCIVIPNGIHPEEIKLSHSKNDLKAEIAERIGAAVLDKTILVTVGRLVKRKGVAWFVAHVMPHLDNTYYFLVVGQGPEYDRIKTVIVRHHLQERVFLLGALSRRERDRILNGSDIFVMPNISLSGDMEGFGIVALEAGSCGLPVIATDTQGIRDAVLDGKTGLLVPEKDTAGFVNAIKNINLNSAAIQSIVKVTFSWSRIYQRYAEALT